MGEMIRLTAADGVTSTPIAPRRSAPPKAGVVVAQEIFGLNHHIRSVADGFAAEGYLAIAPALFDRVRTACGARLRAGRYPQGCQIRARTTLEGAIADIEAAVKAASEAGKVGVVGYCWGGTLAFRRRPAWPASRRGRLLWRGIASISTKSPRRRRSCTSARRTSTSPRTTSPRSGLLSASLGVRLRRRPRLQLRRARSPTKSPADLAKARTLEFLADKLG